MNTFTIFDSVIDPTRPTLSKYVFSFNNNSYELLDGMKHKILNNIMWLPDVANVKNIYITGSIVTFNYTNQSDVDITIDIDDLPIDKFKSIRSKLLDLCGVDMAGPHEINYFVRMGSNLSIDYYDSLYDLLNDEWIIGPAEVGVNVERYINYFDNMISKLDVEKAELLSDLAGFYQLSLIDDDSKNTIINKAQEKLDAINDDIKNIKDTYTNILVKRKNAVENPSAADLIKYKSGNALPDNVVYLLLRKFCYINFLSSIKKIYNENDGEIKSSDVKDVKDAFGNFSDCKTSNIAVKLDNRLKSIQDRID